MTFTITASLNHPDATPSWKQNYCFTDPTTDLVGEPLLDDATAFIKELTQEIHGKAASAVTIAFSDDSAIAKQWINEDEEPIIVELNHPKETSGGTAYEVSVLSPLEARRAYALTQIIGIIYRITLCPMLLRYYDTPPEQLYCKLRRVVDG